MAASGWWRQWSSQWAALSNYQRFEASIAFLLRLIVAIIIVVAVFRLTVSVVGGLLLGVLDPLDHAVFQTVFGEILTVLIALEFNHTLHFVGPGTQSIIHTKVILLIALLALARKFIILDLRTVPADQILGLAAVTLVLGLVYWLMRERDDRLSPPPQGDKVTR